MAALSELQDLELVALLREGDIAAFTEIYNRFKGLLYIYACKIARDEDIAEDLVQDIFIYLWDKRESIQFRSSVASYLYSAIRYKFFDLVDHQKIRADYAGAFQVFLDEGEYVTDNYMAEKELSAIIEREIGNLPEKMREVFLLSRKENLTNQEIADRLGITEKTVRNQVSTALKILRLKLGLLTFLYFLIHY